jgi:hypothetical protein
MLVVREMAAAKCSQRLETPKPAAARSGWIKCRYQNWCDRSQSEITAYFRRSLAVHIFNELALTLLMRNQSALSTAINEVY